jgi:hypothetical protein
MKTSRVVLLAVVVAFWLSGCATYTLVSPGNIKVSGCCSVETPIEWSRSGAGNMEVWTIDGASLEAIYFFKGIRDGETLFNTYNKKIKLPKFRKTMVESEIMEFVVDSMEAASQQNLYVSSLVGNDVQALYLRPYKINADFGFRFELAYLSPHNGLEYDGLIVGIVEKEKLYLVAYAGARQYYFPKYKARVEQLMGTLKLE